MVERLVRSFLSTFFSAGAHKLRRRRERDGQRSWTDTERPELARGESDETGGEYHATD